MATAKKTSTKKMATKKATEKPAMSQSQIDEINRKALGQRLIDIISDGAHRGATDDEIKGEMVTAGAPFSNVNKLFNTIAISQGFMADPKEAIKLAMEDIEESDWESIPTWEILMASVVQIGEYVSEELKVNRALSYKKILSLIRAYCLENEIKLPVKSKKTTKKLRGGKVAAAIISQLNRDKSTSKETMYRTIRPLVKGHKNAVDSVNTFFPMAFAIANGFTLEESLSILKDQAMPESD